MMVLDVIRKRRSTRKYKSTPVSEDVFLRVMEAARLAPSGKNLQPWHFVVVKNQSLKVRLAAAAAHQEFIAEAPMVIVACAFPENSYARMGRYMKSWSVDVAVAVDHLMLQAQEEGLGTCWIGSFHEGEVKAILDIPEHVRVLALTPLGYPDEEPRDRGRKKLEEIVSYEKFR
jgi:nitroreductase